MLISYNNLSRVAADHGVPRKKSILAFIIITTCHYHYPRYYSQAGAHVLRTATIIILIVSGYRLLMPLRATTSNYSRTRVLPVTATTSLLASPNVRCRRQPSDITDRRDRELIESKSIANFTTLLFRIQRLDLVRITKYVIPYKSFFPLRNKYFTLRIIIIVIMGSPLTAIIYPRL